MLAIQQDMLAKTAPLYEPGDVIAGKYQIEGLLGQGGMGAVFRARNLALDAPVAIKVVQRSSDRPLLHGRLLQEARAAAKLSHPNIVKVFDIGETTDGEPFIVMEFLVGQALGTLLDGEQRLPATQAVRLLLPIVDALWLAHGKGIVHRDLKPDNVFIVEHEAGIEPKLLDFGIVKLDVANGGSHLTEGGATVGSPDYMSPEQARGQDDISFLSDVWSFSVMLYETISGKTPFSGANYNALLREIVEVTPPSLLQLGVADAELSAIVERGMRKQAAERFASMGELGRALARWLVQQGVTEDVTGATLEARWLRGDAHVRAVRGSLSSMHDSWPSEAGSGVRQHSLSGGRTVPAPPPDPVVEVARRGRRPPAWTIVAALGAVAFVGALGWWTWVRGSAGDPAPHPPAPARRAEGTEWPRAPTPDLASEPPSPPSPIGPIAAPAPPAAELPPGGLSSTPPEPVRGAAPLKRGPRAAASAQGSPRSKPAPQADDLLSPYQ